MNNIKPLIRLFHCVLAEDYALRLPVGDDLGVCTKLCQGYGSRCDAIYNTGPRSGGS